MCVPSVGDALVRLPACSSTLVASNGAVWIWPGIPLTMRRGAEIAPVAAATIRFWIAHLHGPDCLQKELVWAVCEAIRWLNAGDEIAAQRALDSLGLTALSGEGAAFINALAGQVEVHVPEIVLTGACAPRDASVLQALIIVQPSGFDRFIKAGPWDPSKHPRWPTGTPDSQGGRFAPTDSSGGAAPPSEPPPDVPPLIVTSRRPPTGIGHNQGPPLEEPPEIPEVPISGSARIAFIRSAVQWLIAAFTEASPDTEAFILLLQASSWIMQQCYPYIASFFAPAETLTELQNDANFPAKGYDIHHIVEKAQADTDDIPKSIWDGPENRVRIPTLKHWEITKWYMTPNPDYDGLTPRDYLSGKSWNEKFQVGRKALILFDVLKP